MNLVRHPLSGGPAVRPGQASYVMGGGSLLSARRPTSLPHPTYSAFLSSLVSPLGN